MTAALVIAFVFGALFVIAVAFGALSWLITLLEGHEDPRSRK